MLMVTEIANTLAVSLSTTMAGMIWGFGVRCPARAAVLSNLYPLDPGKVCLPGSRPRDLKSPAWTLRLVIIPVFWILSGSYRILWREIMSAVRITGKRSYRPRARLFRSVVRKVRWLCVSMIRRLSGTVSRVLIGFVWRFSSVMTGLYSLLRFLLR